MEVGSLGSDRHMPDAYQRPSLFEQVRLERSRPHFSQNEISRGNRDGIMRNSRSSALGFTLRNGLGLPGSQKEGALFDEPVIFRMLN